ncbi:hypothetical protein [Actinomadura hibisca]|uniref:hypothetical protein n=1 Tax=Actinomadura hibisca TaxID=68565 RepID=UPI00082DBE74|nr:hypothetical protein [Actinomadura hibisca]
MKHLVNRVRITAGLGATALAAGLLATGPATAAHAETGYTPSPADFKDCPAPPAGAQAWLWNCLSIVITGGEMKLGGLTQKVTKPITIPVAVGLHEWKMQMLTPAGGFQGEPIEVPKENLPLPISGVSVQVSQAGEVKPGKLLVPDVLPMKIKVNHFVFGDKCFIGSQASPINLKPGLSNLGLGKIGDAYVIKTKISDNTFAVPAAAGCGLLNGALNAMVKLPSAAGSNAAALDAVVRIKNYAFGDSTKSYAGERGIR